MLLVYKYGLVNGKDEVNVSLASLKC